MKTFRFLIAAHLFTTAASAQRYSKTPTDNDQSAVYLFSVVAEDDEDCSMQERAMRNKAAVAAAMQDYEDSYRTGFQQVQQPLFILAERNNKFSFGIGGYINLRAGYDFDGIVDNIDFITYDIPIPGTYATKQKLMMDASTSRLFLKGIANTMALGQVEIFVDMDFRGGTAGSYRPRVRSAYAAFMGFTVGRDVTTFCDLDASPKTIDFQGPNAYNFNFATLVRYECNLAGEHLGMGVALEYPKVWGTYGDTFAAIPQRVPDIPVYIQYEWGRDRQSHVRGSAVFRDIYAHDLTTEKNTALFGWGVQASGRVVGSDWMAVVFNGVYGKGITQYIQDLTGSGLDFTPNPENVAELQTTPMYGWQASAEFAITDRLCVTGGYSTVHIDNHNGYYSEQEYKRGEYMFGNIFYNITPRLQVAGEYLYGSRKNVSGMQNHSNRINIMTQFNF